MCDSRSKKGLSRCLIRDITKDSRCTFYHLLVSIFYIGRFGVDVVVCFLQKFFFLLVGYGYYSYSIAVKLFPACRSDVY